MTQISILNTPILIRHMFLFQKCALKKTFAMKEFVMSVVHKQLLHQVVLFRLALLLKNHTVVAESTWKFQSITQEKDAAKHILVMTFLQFTIPLVLK